MADPDEEGLGDEFTAEERDAVQQMRASGVTPAQIVDAVKKKPEPEKPPTKAAESSGMTPQDVARQAQFAAELAITQRDMKNTAKSIVNTYDTLKDDPVELRQVEAEASTAVRSRADYATLNTPDKLNAAFEKAVKEECERRVKKSIGEKASEQRKVAEQRLENQEKAVEGGKGESRSDRPNLGSVGLETFDEAVFGTEAAWPSDEAQFVQQCRKDDIAFVDKKMGRKARK